MSIPEIDPRLAPLLQFIEAGIPFNQYLGLKVIGLVRGECWLRIPAAAHLVGDPFRPAIHGGVISTLADVAGGAACFTMMKSHRDRVSTVDLRIDYLRPGVADRDLVGGARVLRMGNKVAVVRIEVFSGDDRESPVAFGQAVYSVLRHQEVE